MEPISFFNETLLSLSDALEARGIKKFRAKQLYKWVYGRGITDFTQMTDLSKSLRDEMPNVLTFDLPEMVDRRISTDGTEKYLFDVGDGRTVETVLIPADDRMTLCVSSEVGCNLACKFCFTAKQKLVRRLTVAEIVGQFYLVKKILPEEKRISNIVFMGMGEPLDNPDAVFPAIDIFNEAIAFNLSRKKITVSTSGIVPLIPEITRSGTRLAVSLNAVNDKVRSQIMPINNKWPLKDLMAACKEYCYVTGDKVTFEYVLLRGITDSLEDAHQLFELTKDIPCKINIIPFNEHPNSGFVRPEEEQIQRFQDRLIRLGAHVLRRKTKGRDIYAACGQLTSAYKGRPEQLNVATL